MKIRSSLFRRAAVAVAISLTAVACGSSASESAAPDPTVEELAIESSSDVPETVATTTSTTPTSTTTTAPTSSTTTSTTTTTVPDDLPVLTGAQVLANDDFSDFAGMRVGLIAHQNSLVESGHLLDAIAASPNVELAALFGPEHGVRGDADAGVYVDNAVDPTTGAPVFSLFGPTRQPTQAMLADVDVLLYDLQDVGTRYYTYISTMGLAMQAAAEAGIPFVVLDRPNPLGDQVGGGLMLAPNTSFVGQYEIPDVYGLTSGELARFIVDNNALSGIEGLELDVIELVGWDHSMVWDDVGLNWIPPSPAIVSPEAALLYPATIYFESTNLSYGRGTEIPFQIVGAPWLDASTVADELNARSLDGVRFIATTTTPQMLAGMTIEPAYLGQTLPAVQLEVTDPTAIRSAEVGIHLLEVVFANATEAGVDPLSRPAWMDQLSGSTVLRDGLTNGADAAAIVEQQQASIQSVATALDAARLYD